MYSIIDLKAKLFVRNQKSSTEYDINSHLQQIKIVVSVLTEASEFLLFTQNMFI